MNIVLDPNDIATFLVAADLAEERGDTEKSVELRELAEKPLWERLAATGGGYMVIWTRNSKGEILGGHASHTMIKVYPNGKLKAIDFLESLGEYMVSPFPHRTAAPERDKLEKAEIIVGNYDGLFRRNLNAAASVNKSKTSPQCDRCGTVPGYRLFKCEICKKVVCSNCSDDMNDNKTYCHNCQVEHHIRD